MSLQLEAIGVLSTLQLKVLLPTVLTVVCASFTLAADPPRPAPIPVLKLKQTHYYWGESEVYISMDGIRIDNRGRMHFSLVAAKPNWDVTIYRTDDKTCVHESLEEFKATGVVSDFLVKRHAKLFLTRAQKKESIKIFSLDGRRCTNAGELYEYIPLGKLAAPEAEDILYTVYKIATNNGIPTRFIKKLKGVDWLSGVNGDGSVKVYITTQSIESKMISPDLFLPPKGYRTAKSVQEVLLSKDNRDASGDLDEFFDSGKAKPKHQ